MNDAELERVLEQLVAGELDAREAIATIRAGASASLDLGHTTLDLARGARTGASEVIYGEHKTPTQLADAFEALAGRGGNVLATRVSPEQHVSVAARIEGVRYSAESRLLQHKPASAPKPGTRIAVVSAGTSDHGVAAEAAETAAFYDNEVVRINDVGVAGIHRLLARIDEIRAARVVIVVAGMEGALASVVGGLVDKPVIAVPTSVGYGASFGGVAALLAMLNSCASGVCVVNIDNGFGAGFLANRLNRL